MSHYTESTPTEYYILCQSGGGPNSGLALWWRANRGGYTTRLGDAGRYDEVEARSIERIRGTDRAIKCDVVDQVAVRVVSIEAVRELA